MWKLLLEIAYQAIKVLIKLKQKKKCFKTRLECYFNIFNWISKKIGEEKT